MLGELRTQPALIDQVHDRLLEAISTGQLPPGQRLTQEKVAEMLGVSRQPVSHALQLLKHRGLVIEHGKRGLAVAPLCARRIQHLYQVREALDGLAARLAAGRVAAGDIAADQIADAERLLSCGVEIAATAETFELIQADVGFHRALYELSGNPEIAETVAEQWPQFMRSMVVVLEGEGQRQRIWQEHIGILEAIKAGDAKVAEERARAHTRRAGEGAAELLALSLE